MHEHPKIESLCRPNLLINADFKNDIVNQKGRQYYENERVEIYDYTIDMWKVLACGLKVESGFINIFTVLNRTCGIYQDLEKQLQSGNYTLTIKISYMDRGTIYLYPEGYQSQKKTITKAGLYSYTFNNIAPKGVAMELINVNANIEFVKLEEGSYFTGMSHLNYSLELLKCQRYLVCKTFVISRSSSNCFTVGQLPTKMIKTPTLKTTKCYVSSAGVNTAELTIRSYSVDQDTLYYIEFENSAPFDGGNEVGRSAWCTLELDAYNY